MSNLNVEFYYDPDGLLGAREVDNPVDVPVLRDGTLGVIESAREELLTACSGIYPRPANDKETSH